MSTMRVYKFWAEPASRADAAIVADQIRRADDYRWELARIENRRRALERARDMATPLELRAMLALLADKATPAEVVVEVKRQVKAMRAARNATDAWRVESTAINGAARAAVRWARGVAADAGLYWGTYLLIEEAHDMACRTTPIYEDIKVPRRPSEGAIGVQIQSTRPMSCVQFEDGEDTRARLGRDLYALGPRVDGFRARAPAGHRNRSGGAARCRLREAAIRVGSTDGRAPVWARFHTIIHRPLPAGRVTGVRIHQERCGLRLRWSLQVVIQLEGTGVRADVGDPASAAVGVDLGWRRLDDGSIRVAMAVGTDGRRHELAIEPGVLRRQKKSDDLRSIRDAHTNRVRAMLGALRDGAPAWFREATEHLHLWHRVSRFVGLHRTWADPANRWDGDQAAFLMVGQWLEQDRHLLDWEQHNLRRMRHQVRGRFAAFSAALARAYGTIVVEDLDLSDLRARGRAEPTDGAPNVGEIADARAAVVAPGEFRAELIARAGAFGRTVVKINPAYTTRACAGCGTVAEAGVVEITATCAGCGLTEDQDVRAAKNILASGLLPPFAGDPLASSKSKASRKIGARRGTRKNMSSRPLENAAKT